MKNVFFKIASVGILVFAMSGCSCLFTDHTNGYQDETNSIKLLQMPSGSLHIQDDFVIPHQDMIPNLANNKEITEPRAPFIYHPMVDIPVSLNADSITFTAPASMSKTKKIVKDFLNALHGEGVSIASKFDDHIISVPFEFDKKGFWSSLGSFFTRSYSKKIVFSFTFEVLKKNTLISIQYKQKEQGKDVDDWRSPIKNARLYTDVIRLWGTMGTSLNKTSVLFSQTNKNTPSPIWVDRQGVFAIHLKSKDDLATQVKQAGLHFVNGKEGILAVDKSDIKPDSLSSQMKFPYHTEHQSKGDFLVIDVSKVKNPEIMSFQLVQRFVFK